MAAPVSLTMSGVAAVTAAQRAGCVAMSTPSVPSPFDQLLPVLAAAQKLGVTPWGWTLQIEFTFANGSSVTKVPMPVLPTLAAPQDSTSAPRFDPHDFDPTPLQSRILRYLLTGPKSSTQLRNHTSGHMYDANGGMADLIAVGLVEKILGKCKLTPFGEEFAAAQTDEDEQ